MAVAKFSIFRFATIGILLVAWTLMSHVALLSVFGCPAETVKSCNCSHTASPPSIDSVKTLNGPLPSGEAPRIEARTDAFPMALEHVNVGQRILLKAYLDLLINTVTGAALQTDLIKPTSGELKYRPFDPVISAQGGAWCRTCITMGGSLRVSNVVRLLQDVMEKGIEGDFAETGVWRGGISVVASILLRLHDTTHSRKVWVCDSFAGLPKNSTEADDPNYHEETFMASSIEEVTDNFKMFYGPPDARVQFIKGYFQHSLTRFSIGDLQHARFAVLRGDGDMYESYNDILYNMYDKLSVGGYFICDDCRCIKEADRAAAEFRARHDITSPLVSISGKRKLLSRCGQYWRKSHGEKEVDWNWYLRWNRTRAIVARRRL